MWSKTLLTTVLWSISSMRVSSPMMGVTSFIRSIRSIVIHSSDFPWVYRVRSVSHRLPRTSYTTRLRHLSTLRRVIRISTVSPMLQKKISSSDISPIRVGSHHVRIRVSTHPIHFVRIIKRVVSKPVLSSCVRQDSGTIPWTVDTSQRWISQMLLWKHEHTGEATLRSDSK